MTNEEFHKILNKYFQGIASNKEEELLENFYQDRLQNSRGIESWSLEEKEEARLRMQKHLKNQVRSSPQNRFIIPKSKWGIASVIIVAIGISIWFSDFTSMDNTSPNRADYMTKVSARGQKLTVRLSDGSIVKLNSESKIIYPQSFENTSSREIQLTGEAFFEVTKDETKPFVITSGELVTSVLGTSFNIKAYPKEETISVTVATGRVRVETKTNSLSKQMEILTPGQQGFFDKKNTDLMKSEVDLEKFLSWKDNKIVFDDLPFIEAITILERWFDQEITFEDPQDAADCYISGKFENESLDNILDGLKFLKGFDYQILNNKSILITGKPCTNL